MSTAAIQRDHALAILQPNPMWIIGQTEREILMDALLPVQSPEGKPFLYGAIDCWDDHIDAGINNIRILATFRREDPKMALLTLHRETTVDDSTFVTIDGDVIPRRDLAVKRQYFDGYALDAEEIGHVAVACVDFEKKKIWTQDPQGVEVKPLIRQAFEEHFPDFEFTDLMMKQQWDAHSCSIITMSNLECFSTGNTPLGHVDVEALRLRYAQVLDGYDAQHGAVQPNRYYEVPVTKLRYTPV